MAITFESMKNLVVKGLATERYDPVRDLYTFKYHSCVFYHNRWGESEDLLECRGIVFNGKGEVVQRPFKKIFNYGENGVGLDIPKDRKVVAVRKINGFMAAATWHDGGLLVSTTGTTTSDFVQLAKKWLYKYEELFRSCPRFTFLFEIVDESDPHIVHEESGPYLLGMRHKETGRVVGFPEFDFFDFFWDIRTPEWSITTMGEILEINRNAVDIEGFVLYDFWTGEMLLKTKTPHYLSKKALMRMGRSKAYEMYHSPQKFKERLDEEFFEILDHILINYSYDQWRDYSEQDRRKIIEEFFQGESE